LSARAENQGEWWDRQRLLFTIACLLHDCAHAPFSHTLEYAYQHISHEKITNSSKLSRKERKLANYLNSCGAEHEFGAQLEYLSELDWQAVNEFADDSNDFMADYFSLKKREGESSKLKTCGKEHEKLSALMLRKEPSMKEGIEIIYSDRFPGLSITAADIEFMARAILGCLYSQKHESETLGDVIDKELRNCLIKLLNSDLGFDVDGFDYTVRDTKNSGYDNYSVDYQRILSSFTLVKVGGVYQLGVKHGCTGILRQYIDARNSLYRDIYAHHKVTFMSSVLRPELLKLSAKWLCCKAFMFPEVTDDTERRQRACECLSGSLGTVCEFQKDIYYSDFITAKLLGFDDFCGATDKHFSCGYHIHHSTDTDLDFIFKQIYKESAGYESAGAKIVNRYLKAYFERDYDQSIWKVPEELPYILGEEPGYKPLRFSCGGSAAGVTPEDGGGHPQDSIINALMREDGATSAQNATKMTELWKKTDIKQVFSKHHVFFPICAQYQNPSKKLNVNEIYVDMDGAGPVRLAELLPRNYLPDYGDTEDWEDYFYLFGYVDKDAENEDVAATHSLTAKRADRHSLNRGELVALFEDLREALESSADKEMAELLPDPHSVPLSV
jgi:hypothetical protein